MLLQQLISYVMSYATLSPAWLKLTHSLILFPHTLYGLLSKMFVSFCVRCGCAAVQLKYLNCDWILIKSEQRKWQPNDDVSYLRSLQKWRITRQTFPTCVRRASPSTVRASVIERFGVCRSYTQFRVLFDSRLAPNKEHVDCMGVAFSFRNHRMHNLFSFERNGKCITCT